MSTVQTWASYRRALWRQHELAATLGVSHPDLPDMKTSQHTADITVLKTCEMDAATSDFFCSPLAVQGRFSLWGSARVVTLHTHTQPGWPVVAWWPTTRPCRAVSFVGSEAVVVASAERLEIRDLVEWDRPLADRTCDVHVHSVRSQERNTLHVGIEGAFLGFDLRSGLQRPQTKLALPLGVCNFNLEDVARQSLAIAVEDCVLVRDMRMLNKQWGRYHLNANIKALAWNGPKLAYGGGMDDPRVVLRHTTHGIIGSQTAVGQVTDVRFVSDRLLLSSHGWDKNSLCAGSVQVWDLTLPRPLAVTHFDDRVLSLVPDERVTVTAATTKSVTSLSVDVTAKAAARPHSGPRFEFRVR